MFREVEYNRLDVFNFSCSYRSRACIPSTIHIVIVADISTENSILIGCINPALDTNICGLWWCELWFSSQADVFVIHLELQKSLCPKELKFLSALALLLFTARRFIFQRFYEKAFLVWEEDYDVCSLSHTKPWLSRGPIGKIKTSATQRLTTRNSNRDVEGERERRGL